MVNKHRRYCLNIEQNIFKKRGSKEKVCTKKEEQEMSELFSNGKRVRLSGYGSGINQIKIH